MSSVQKSAIIGFLKNYKFFLQKAFILVERSKNLQFMASRGIKHEDIKQHLFQLTAADYVSGPEPDRGKPGQNVWVFQSQLNDKKIYIKLSDNFNGVCAKCISFHD